MSTSNRASRPELLTKDIPVISFRSIAVAAVAVVALGATIASGEEDKPEKVDAAASWRASAAASGQVGSCQAGTQEKGSPVMRAPP